MTNISFSDVKEVEVQEIGTLADQLKQDGLLAVRLAADSNVSELKTDIVVHNANMFLDGRGRTIEMQTFQFYVEGGAALCLYNLHLVDGRGVGSLLDCQ